MWDKITEKPQNVSLSLDFVNKPPSLISPPLKVLKLNKAPGGLLELLWYPEQDLIIHDLPFVAIDIMHFTPACLFSMVCF